MAAAAADKSRKSRQFGASRYVRPARGLSGQLVAAACTSRGQSVCAGWVVLLTTHVRPPVVHRRVTVVDHDAMAPTACLLAGL